MTSIKGGNSFLVTIITTDVAPASNARVDLKWEGAVGILVSPPSFVDVPAGLNNIAFAVKTSKTTAAKRIRLSASSLGAPLETSVRITP
jgi:hypothetical protein